MNTSNIQWELKFVEGFNKFNICLGGENNAVLKKALVYVSFLNKATEN